MPSATGQTACEPPRICATPKLLDDAAVKKANNLCAKARRDVPRYRGEAVKERKRADQCEGRVYQAERTPIVKPLSPWWLRAAFTGAIGAGGVGLGGVIVGSGAPELIIGVAVFEAGMIAARLMLQWLDDR